ncbi:hypothetical protein V1508DRAFT_451154 [Lipomyces doorenjongii]|uniref:uncharacterized protein n=1 Tax=Lipomyces doorenjongii TaxID=383834 RepID=UPI0034CEFF6C
MSHACRGCRYIVDPQNIINNVQKAHFMTDLPCSSNYFYVEVSVLDEDEISSHRQQLHIPADIEQVRGHAYHPIEYGIDFEELKGSTRVYNASTRERSLWSLACLHLQSHIRFC